MDKEYLEYGALIDYLEKRMEKYPVFLGVVCPRIADFPKADVVEVKHGRWLKHITDELHEVWCDKCSVCGFELDDLITAEGYNYCPNCGAKMDGENNG